MQAQHSIERRATVAVIAAGLIAALAAAGVIAVLTRGAAVTEASVAGNAADAIAASIGKGNAPQPLLDALIAAGQIRSATVYGKDGRVLAVSGSPSGGELVCRSISGGNTVCAEPAAIAASTPARAFLRGAAAAAGIAIIIAGALAWILVGSIRRLLRSLRDDVRIATRDDTLSTRLAIPRGEVGPLSQSINDLLEEMQKREVTLRRRTAELETVNKDLESFAHMVSHDLRSPLGAVSGFAQALGEDFAGTLTEEAAECVHWIRDGCEQMQKLIDGLLQMARLTRAEMQREEVDLSDMARNIASSLQRSSPDRDVDFTIYDGVVANGDEHLLRAVLENLMTNAWKFTSKKQHARIEIGMRNDNGWPEYFVRDNGAGFDPSHAAKMFRPFQRLHSTREFEGTGIGLATVQKIIQKHGGRAWAEGAPDQGATIWFTTRGTAREAM
ncbi:MAG TPA: ATP-binding protein [Thermoanaerobaculia bacterium]|jgi:signal transduction histidine kinase|nr:ATP-binding protein [Thermoanaerobaculia bacterium]